jgi:hypothetical protein
VVPVKEAVNLPLSDVCHLPHPLPAVLLSSQVAEPLKLSLWKAEGNQNRSETGLDFQTVLLQEQFCGSQYLNTLVPVCFIDVSDCKSDSFSAQGEIHDV